MRLTAIAASLVLMTGSVALAADMSPPEPVAPPPPPASDWTITVAPYVWAAGIKGKVGAGGFPPAHIDASIGEVLSDFDIGFMGAAEVRNDRFSIYSDIVYVKLSDSAKTPNQVLADKVKLTTQELMWTGALGYTITDSPTYALDMVAGFRLWSLDNKLKVKGGLIGSDSFSSTETWVDPIVGLKFKADLTPSIYWTSWALIGGFGAGSDFMWDVLGGFGYRFTDNISAIAGYRAVSVDYTNDGFKFDVVQQGPIMGAAIRF
ncbi:opacity protein-like surface antigen [Rhodoligotrophos appendicifer]|uniref:hypothetical protein n=1 Tax=Rhodoligotrophos appendicifer TaxID=987056 RepID=UPI001184E510|nr:hypothetical protein [Rhodoligotrophos appendicifer]